MITLTEAAAKQIQLSANQGQMKGLPLRLAAKRNPDNSLHYAMGFDDIPSDNDHKFSSEGIDIVIADSSVDLLKDTIVDYVELEPDKFHFIFLNPNDPNYVPPKAQKNEQE